jgi:hypothetical protein
MSLAKLLIALNICIIGSTGCFQKAFGEPVSMAEIAQTQQLFYMNKQEYD